MNNILYALLGVWFMGIMTGCGSTAMKENTGDTDVVMVSKGEASFIYRAFVGGVDYCKVVQSGDQKYEVVLDYEKDRCQVTLETKRKERDVQE